jgi:hypothetical protein
VELGHKCADEVGVPAYLVLLLMSFSEKAQLV